MRCRRVRLTGGQWRKAAPEVNKREAILSDISDFVLAEGLEAATLRAMALAAGQSDRMLLYYFEDKDQILREVVDHLTGRFEAQLTQHVIEGALRKEALHARLDELVMGATLWPHLRFGLDLAARAARGDALVSAAALRMEKGFHRWIEGQLTGTDPNLRRQQATEILIGLRGVVALKAAGLGALVEEIM